MGRHRRHWTTPKHHRASRLIAQPSWPSRGFRNFFVGFAVVLVAVAVRFGAVVVVPPDAPATVAYTVEQPVTAALVGEYWR